MNSSQETKNYVTPYAFGVSDGLVGKALASPSRRLCALLVDLLVVASLTLMSVKAFTFVMFTVSVVGYFKSKARKTGHMAQTVFIMIAVLSVMVFTGAMLVDKLSWEGSLFSTEQAASVGEASESSNDEQGQSGAEPSSYSLIDYIKGFLSDMGLGFGWAAVYFSVFVAWFNGQTIGKMIFRIQVMKIDATTLTFWQSFERYGGYSAGLATGLMGFLQIIWDPNRQAIHDKISETVVLDLRKPDKRPN